jgi:hypothetical protein
LLEIIFIISINICLITGYFNIIIIKKIEKLIYYIIYINFNPVIIYNTIYQMTSYPSSPFIWYDPVLGLEMQQNMVTQQPIPTPTHNLEYHAWLEAELKTRFQAQTQAQIQVNRRPVRQTRQPAWLHSGNYNTK